MGNSDPEHINTRNVELSNLTMRLMNRQFIRLILGFSKKIESHILALAPYAFQYTSARFIIYSVALGRLPRM
jgi:hypothetical protein